MPHTHASVTWTFELTGASTEGGYVLITIGQGRNAITLAERGYPGRCDGYLNEVVRDGETTTGELSLSQRQTGRFRADVMEMQANVVYSDYTGADNTRSSSNMVKVDMEGQLLREVVSHG